MTEDIAKIIRKGWRPEGKVAQMEDLAAQARRLDGALKVAEGWMEAAFSAQSTEMTARAEYMRDHIQEELSRVCFEMEVGARRTQYGEGHEEEAQHAAVADTLLTAYCILRDAPDSYFGSGVPRARYEVMGALMVAMDAANAEIERLEPEKNTA